MDRKFTRDEVDVTICDIDSPTWSLQIDIHAGDTVVSHQILAPYSISYDDWLESFQTARRWFTIEGTGRDEHGLLIHTCIDIKSGKVTPLLREAIQYARGAGLPFAS